jgi:DNA-binding NarL/FixJ family response regulator
MRTGKPSVVVLDRHPMWLDGVGIVMDRFGIDVVAMTTVPRDALAAIAEHEPSLFVVDPAVRDDDGDWLEHIAAALELLPELKVVAMSASGAGDVIQASFAAGAAANVVKTASEGDIGAALRLALTSAIHLPPAAGATAPSPRPTGEESELTRRELEILALVAEGHSNAALGRKLWVTEQTVKFHLSNIYRKLGVHNRTAAARWASLHGIVAPAERSPRDHVAA